MVPDRELVAAWLDRHPGAYLALVGLLLVVAMTLAIRALLTANRRGPDWRWGLVMIVLLAAGRWPCRSIASGRPACRPRSIAIRATCGFYRGRAIFTDLACTTICELPFRCVIRPMGLLFQESGL